jgi:hypothetical protein
MVKNEKFEATRKRGVRIVQVEDGRSLFLHARLTQYPFHL